ncbi:hypothetical protein ES708_08033 [subsurface metagenome]
MSKDRTGKVMDTATIKKTIQALKALGINLDAEFTEIYREIPISTDHRKLCSYLYE